VLLSIVTTHDTLYTYHEQELDIVRCVWVQIQCLVGVDAETLGKAIQTLNVVLGHQCRQDILTVIDYDDAQQQIRQLGLVQQRVNHIEQLQVRHNILDPKERCQNIDITLLRPSAAMPSQRKLARVCHLHLLQTYSCGTGCNFF
jgi:hypothetical protein